MMMRVEDGGGGEGGEGEEWRLDPQGGGDGCMDKGAAQKSRF